MRIQAVLGRGLNHQAAKIAAVIASRARLKPHTVYLPTPTHATPLVPSAARWILYRASGDHMPQKRASFFLVADTVTQAVIGQKPRLQLNIAITFLSIHHLIMTYVIHLRHPGWMNKAKSCHLSRTWSIKPLLATVSI